MADWLHEIVPNPDMGTWTDLRFYDPLAYKMLSAAFGRIEYKEGGYFGGRVHELTLEATGGLVIARLIEMNDFIAVGPKRHRASRHIAQVAAGHMLHTGTREPFYWDQQVPGAELVAHMPDCYAESKPVQEPVCVGINFASVHRLIVATPDGFADYLNKMHLHQFVPAPYVV